MRPDLAVTPSAITIDRVTVQVHNLGCVQAPASVLRLLDDKGRVMAETGVPEIPGISGFDPQIKELTIAVPGGFVPEKCILTVDPENKINEINESNNSYSLSQGIPPPVETPPGKR